MNPLLRTVICSALLLNAVAVLSSTNSISGTVKDSEGAVIGRATITIDRDSSVVGKENADTVVTSRTPGSPAQLSRSARTPHYLHGRLPAQLLSFRLPVSLQKPSALTSGDTSVISGWAEAVTLVPQCAFVASSPLG